jgi:hypothetical protein
MANPLFNKKSLFTIKFDFKFKEGTGKVLYLKYSLEWWCNLDALESRSKIPGKF